MLGVSVFYNFIKVKVIEIRYVFVYDLFDNNSREECY